MDNIADKSSNLPHMLPTAQAFAAVADALGIASSTQVVVYDRLGIFSAARVWWTFKVFGHDRYDGCHQIDCRVLIGKGLPCQVLTVCLQYT